jgi:hypothetical protein
MEVTERTEGSNDSHAADVQEPRGKYVTYLSHSSAEICQLQRKEFQVEHEEIKSIKA